MGHDEPIPRFDRSSYANTLWAEYSSHDRIDGAAALEGDAEGTDVDYRFSLANERTYLAWIRTALASVAGGIAAAKALPFHHESVRWLISAPPIIAGSLLGLEAVSRWRRYEQSMRAQTRLPVGHRMKLIAIGLAAYALIALLAVILDH
jgi:inner membrane protein YidH